jgi:hypothetical protein
MSSRSLVTTILIMASSIGSVARAEEREFPGIGKTLVVEKAGRADSDATGLRVSLRDDQGGVSVDFPRMLGPLFLSVENSQIFS